MVFVDAAHHENTVGAVPYLAHRMPLLCGNWSEPMTSPAPTLRISDRSPLLTGSDQPPSRAERRATLSASAPGLSLQTSRVTPRMVITPPRPTVDKDRPKAPTPTLPIQHLLTRREVAKIIGVHFMTTYRIPLPPPIRITKRTLRWDPHELAAWLEKRK